MSTDLHNTMYRLWEAASTDTPARPSCQVKAGQFVLTITGNRERWTDVCKAAGVPDHAVETITGEVLTCTWPSHADAIFGADGLMAQRKPGYEVRLPQLHMARLVQRSIEMGAPAVIEAGTGTGKSFAYAAIAMAMGVRTVISTSNKALQMQLYRKDLPFLQTLFPGKTIALAVGKGNYACRAKCESLGNVTITEPQLSAWYLSTDTGNTEEITFPLPPKALSGINVDDDCTGKHCEHYGDCFYYQAKAARQHADIVVCNHKVLCLHQLWPQAGILPGWALLVVDEAHKLPDYARDTLGADFSLPTIERVIDKARKYADVRNAEIGYGDFANELGNYLRNRDGFQVGLNDHELKLGYALALTLNEVAEQVWPDGNLPTDSDEVRQFKTGRRVRTLATHLADVSMVNHLVRWLEPERRDEPLTLCAKPHDVSAFVGQLAGVETVTGGTVADHTQCARCARPLTASHVAVLEGKPYGPDCIKYVDALGDAEVVDLETWLSEGVTAVTTQQIQTPAATVFCSATLATPDLAYFMREAGLPDALQLVAASPFDFERNALLYVPNGASPAPNDSAWLSWLIDELRTLVLASKGGALLLFTSYNAMNEAAKALDATFTRSGITVWVQGDLPKLELTQRFRADGNAVLFATKSFFEGIDVPGDALRLLVVDKLPFEAPSPLGAAMEAAATDAAKARGMTGNQLSMYPFNAVRIPRMTTELKQALGRLIRTRDDTGVMAVLDSRLRSTQYGRKQVIPALPPAALVNRREHVQVWFAETPVTTVTGPMPEALAIETLSLATVDELPF